MLCQVAYVGIPEDSTDDTEPDEEGQPPSDDVGFSGWQQQEEAGPGAGQRQQGGGGSGRGGGGPGNVYSCPGSWLERC